VSTDGAVRITNECVLAANARQELIVAARYALKSDGTHRCLEPVTDEVESIGHKTRTAT